MKNLWKQTALQKQLQFKKSLGLTQCGTFKNKPYEHILADDDARFGANYYAFGNPVEWQGLLFWANIKNNRSVDFESKELKNMLRSEHIPYNLIYPLENLRNYNPELVAAFLEHLLNNAIKVDEVIQIKIAYEGANPEQLLNDQTSFDVYVEYLSDGKKCGIGIEVKYTEQSSPYRKLEKEKMFGLKNSEYLALTHRCGYYMPNSIVKLRKPKLKKLWRNHLLGIKMVELGEIQQFYSIHLFPEKNSYQADAAKCYKNCLNEEFKNKFIPLTYEQFIAAAEKILGANQYISQVNWIDYLKKRY